MIRTEHTGAFSGEIARQVLVQRNERHRPTISMASRCRRYRGRTNSAQETKRSLPAFSRGKHVFERTRRRVAQNRVP